MVVAAGARRQSGGSLMAAARRAARGAGGEHAGAGGGDGAGGVASCAGCCWEASVAALSCAGRALTGCGSIVTALDHEMHTALHAFLGLGASVGRHRVCSRSRDGRFEVNGCVVSGARTKGGSLHARRGRRRAGRGAARRRGGLARGGWAKLGAFVSAASGALHVQNKSGAVRLFLRFAARSAPGWRLRPAAPMRKTSVYCNFFRRRVP